MDTKLLNELSRTTDNNTRVLKMEEAEYGKYLEVAAWRKNKGWKVISFDHYLEAEMNKIDQIIRARKKEMK